MLQSASDISPKSSNDKLAQKRPRSHYSEMNTNSAGHQQNLSTSGQKLDTSFESYFGVEQSASNSDVVRIQVPYSQDNALSQLKKTNSQDLKNTNTTSTNEKKKKRIQLIQVDLKKNDKETNKKVKCDNDKCHLDFESEKDLQIHIKKRGKSVKLHTCQRCYFVSCTKIDFDIHIKKASCSRVDSKLQLEKSHLKESITNDKKNSQDKENIDDIKDFIDKTNPKKKDENNKKTVENFKKTSNKVSKIKAVFREKRTFCLKSNFWK